MRTSRRAGFTLIELMVVIFIFGMMATAVIANYSVNQQAQNLRASANEIAQHIREAQSLALSGTPQNVCSIDRAICGSGSLCDPTLPVNCTAQSVTIYGVAFNIGGSNNTYAVFADTSTGVGCHSGCYNNGEALGGHLYTLPPGITFTSVVVNPAPPSNPPAIFFNNLTTFGSCSACTSTITLQAAVTGATKTIKFRDATGTVSIQ